MTTGASQTQALKAMLKEKIGKLKNRVFCRHGKKLLRDLTMNTRSTISRICPIQSLITGWFRLGGII